MVIYAREEKRATLTLNRAGATVSDVVKRFIDHLLEGQTTEAAIQATESHNWALGENESSVLNGMKDLVKKLGRKDLPGRGEVHLPAQTIQALGHAITHLEEGLIYADTARVQQAYVEIRTIYDQLGAVGQRDKNDILAVGSAAAIAGDNVLRATTRQEFNPDDYLAASSAIVSSYASINNESRKLRKSTDTIVHDGAKKYNIALPEGVGAQLESAVQLMENSVIANNLQGAREAYTNINKIFDAIFDDGIKREIAANAVAGSAGNNGYRLLADRAQAAELTVGDYFDAAKETVSSFVSHNRLITNFEVLVGGLHPSAAPEKPGEAEYVVTIPEQYAQRLEAARQALQHGLIYNDAPGSQHALAVVADVFRQMNIEGKETANPKLQMLFPIQVDETLENVNAIAGLDISEVMSRTVQAKQNGNPAQCMEAASLITSTFVDGQSALQYQQLEKAKEKQVESDQGKLMVVPINDFTLRNGTLEKISHPIVRDKVRDHEVSPERQVDLVKKVAFMDVDPNSPEQVEKAQKALLIAQEKLEVRRTMEMQEAMNNGSLVEPDHEAIRERRQKKKKDLTTVYNLPQIYPAKPLEIRAISTHL